MQAIVQHAYGDSDVLRVSERPVPTPAADEVLLRVRASSVHADVWHVMTGLPKVLRLMGSGLWRPKNPVPGTDLAGTVVAVGAAVTRFKAGDAVFGESMRGMQWCNSGAWAEFATAPETGLALKPAPVSFGVAAALPTAGLIALMNLRAFGRLQPGQDLLINGAAGGVGTLALQMAKAWGCRVSAVDRGDKLGFLRGLGADQVIDYTRTDFTQAGQRYDVILDLPGNHSLSQIKRALKPTGRWVLVGHDNYGHGMRRWLGPLPRMFALMARSKFDPQLPTPSFTLPDKAVEMEQLRQWLEAGLVVPPIDRAFKLAEAAEAMRYLQRGDVKGKVVLTMGEGA